jgi:hypothetical protein
MALTRIFDEPDIEQLLAQNSAPPYGARDTALIMGAVFWGLTPLELTMVRTESIIAPSGEFYRVWVLPADASFNGKAREIHTEDQVLGYFEKYVKLRMKKKWLLSNLHSHCGLDPYAAFFLTDKGKAFPVTERKGKAGTYHPYSMNKHLKMLIDRSGLYGATASSYRNSFINLLHREGVTLIDLMDITGISSKRTLESKIRPHESEVRESLNSIFSRVKFPKHLQEDI